MGKPLIGHASHDENGHLRGGKAGEQNGKEVYVRDWYNRPWNCVIEFKDSKMAEKAAWAMERACANSYIGYDQDQRNSLLKEARKYDYDPGKVAKNVETDCSALVALCCMYAGVPENELVVDGNSAYTGNLRSLLKKTGLVVIHTDSKYLTSGDYNKRGAILLYEGHHVAIQLENGSKVKTITETVISKPQTVSNKTTNPVKYSGYIGKVTASALNIRKGAGMDYGVKGTFNQGDYIWIEKVNKDETWGYANGKGWVSLKWVEKQLKSIPGTVTANSLNVRYKAEDTDGDVKKVLKKGATVSIKQFNMKGTWGYDLKTSGWVSLKYIRFK